MPDEADALWLQPRRAQPGHEIDQPLRLVNQKKPPAPPQRPRRSRAERVKRAADFASRGAETVLRVQMPAFRRVIGRIGQHTVKASGRDFRVRLPQIAADDAKAVGNSVFLRVFPRLPRSGLLNFNAAYAQCLIRAQQQKPQRPAPAAKIKHSAARLYPAEICQHHGIRAHAELCV